MYLLVLSIAILVDDTGPTFFFVAMFSWAYCVCFAIEGDSVEKFSYAYQAIVTCYLNMECQCRPIKPLVHLLPQLCVKQKCGLLCVS